MRAVIAVLPPQWQESRKKSEAAQWDEMWEGVLHMPPMANRMHQNLARDLLIYLTLQWSDRTGGRVNQEVNLTTPADEENWTYNLRIPDLVLLDPPRFGIERNEYMAGAPLVVIEVYSPGDEAYEKLPFYSALGVPETWIFHRETKAVELFRAVGSEGYIQQTADADGWLRSPATGVEFRQTRPGKVWLRVACDEATAVELPKN